MEMFVRKWACANNTKELTEVANTNAGQIAIDWIHELLDAQEDVKGTGKLGTGRLSATNLRSANCENVVLLLGPTRRALTPAPSPLMACKPRKPILCGP